MLSFFRLKQYDGIIDINTIVLHSLRANEMIDSRDSSGRIHMCVAVAIVANIFLAWDR